jgi:hypothetical protein
MEDVKIMSLRKETALIKNIYCVILLLIKCSWTVSCVIWLKFPDISFPEVGDMIPETSVILIHTK